MTGASRSVEVRGAHLHVRISGAPREDRPTGEQGLHGSTPTRAAGAPTAVLVHGFPHTGEIWSEVAHDLARDHHVVVPDLRGFGRSTLVEDQLDAETLAADLEELWEALDLHAATLVALDAGVAPAFLLALRRPELVEHLVLVEATLGHLPGAESFFAAGAPWWFSFHAVPGLAESVLSGNEAAYVGWFYDQGTRHRGVRPDVRQAIAQAYSAPGALRSALAYYRSLPQSNDQLLQAVAGRHLRVPTSAVGAAPVGRALEDQLRAHTDDLTGHLLADCGHIVPLDRPHELAAIIRQQVRPLE